VCCGGEYGGLDAALAAPGKGGVMAKLYTTIKGAVNQIGNYGQASNDVPAIVPEEVAAEFSGNKEFRVEREEAEAARKPAKGKEA
jgi:hypothetical protein